MIRERSVAGSNRVAEAGAWLGGIVPYGYRKSGHKLQSRLVVSEDFGQRSEKRDYDIQQLALRLEAELRGDSLSS